MALLGNFGWNKITIIVGRRYEWIQIKDAIKVFSINICYFDNGAVNILFK